MAQAKVFHAGTTEDERMYDPRHDGAWPLDDAHYTLVATVEISDDYSDIDAREHAFERTNSIDRCWWHNPGVTPHVALNLARSTSVGDIVMFDGLAWRVEGAGWSVVAAVST